MDECIFCKIASGEEKSWKVYEDESVYAFLDINPASEYHTLVLPRKHFTNIFDIPEQELIRVMVVVKRLTDLYNDRLGINDVQIINSSGRDAQQDVFHFHFHIVPRSEDDGQDIVWNTNPALREKFSQMIERIK